MALRTLQAAAAEDKPLPSLPSPTLTNPDMVLPDSLPEDAVRSPVAAARPPSPSYLIAQHGQKLYPGGAKTAAQGTRRTITRKKTFQRSRGPPGRAAFDDDCDSPARYPEAAYGSSPTVSMAAGPTPKKSRLAEEDRRISVGASSINSEDWEAMQMPVFAGLDSDTETLGDELDIGTPPSETSYTDDYISKRQEPERSSATLMRAELILANAKKRLNLMDQNLRVARQSVVPLTTANLRRATSLNTSLAQSSFYNRARVTSREAGDPQLSSTPLGETLGHSRVLSDPAPSPGPFMSFNRTSAPVNSRQGPPPVTKFSPSWTPNALRGSRSSETLQSGRTTPRPVNRISPEPQLSALTEEDSSVKEDLSERSRSHRPSTAQDLREQMHELKGRISNLRERAREDSLRRRSMQSLRDSTPLTDANTSQKPKESLGHIRRVSSSPGVVRPPDPHIPSPSSAVFVGIRPELDDQDRSDTTPTKQRSGLHSRDRRERSVSPVSSNREDMQAGSSESAISPLKEDVQLTDRSAVSPVKDRMLLSTGNAVPVSRFSAYSTFSDREGDISDDDDGDTTEGETTEGESIYEDAPTTQQRHEDREDAFDYGNFYLHSALGTFSRPRGASVSSADSDETARGPERFDQVPATPETPETLRNIEVQRGLHKRGISTESVASIATFETAKEGRQTPSVAMADWLAPARSKSRVGDDERAGSRATSVRTRSPTVNSPTFVTVPPAPSAIAVTALLDPHLGPLGLKDKALVFTLVESLRMVCEKLQLGDETENESRTLRRRLDDARRALDGVVQVNA
ncbi:hypothetical protein MBLNU459_g6846t3 [Dothideomycetes sp. NU459]